MQQFTNKFTLNDKHKTQAGHPANAGYFGYDSPKEFNVNFIPDRSGTWRIEIDDVIDSVSQFSTAIQALELAKEDDQVEIHLQSPGGNVDASGALLHAMMKCKAPIHVTATGGVHSAATHILLSSDSFDLSDNFNALIHNGSSGTLGNLNEIYPRSDFEKVFTRKQYWDTYEGFLSPTEFDGVMRGDQIWLDAQAWCDRALARLEYFKAKQKEAEKSAIVADEEFVAPKAKPKKAPAKKPATKKKSVAKPIEFNF